MRGFCRFIRLNETFDIFQCSFLYYNNVYSENWSYYRVNVQGGFERSWWSRGERQETRTTWAEIETGIQLFSVFTAGRPVLLVVMRHTFSPDGVGAERTRLETNLNVQLTVDCLCSEDRVLTCPRNDLCWREVQEFLRPSQVTHWLFSQSLYPTRINQPQNQPRTVACLQQTKISREGISWHRPAPFVRSDTEKLVWLFKGTRIWFRSLQILKLNLYCCRMGLHVSLGLKED